MNINDIKAKINAKAAALNITVPTPIKESVPQEKEPAAVSAPTTKEMIVEEKKPAKRTRKTAAKSNSNVEAAIPNIEDIISKELVPNVDYAQIPGCGKKPALLKAGAERLAAIFHLRTCSEVINRIEQYDKLFVLYEVKTTVYDAANNIIAVGIGSANTKEPKYARQNFATTLNTVLKIARKRSYVDAILSATGSSRVFTQDIEDIASGTVDLVNHQLKEA